MTLDVYRGRKTTMQQQQIPPFCGSSDETLNQGPVSVCPMCRLNINQSALTPSLHSLTHSFFTSSQTLSFMKEKGSGGLSPAFGSVWEKSIVFLSSLGGVPEI